MSATGTPGGGPDANYGDDERVVVMKLEILADKEAVARRAAELFNEMANATVSKSSSTDDPFCVALAGGTTPQLLYRLLVQSPWKEAIPWSRIYWFIGDERAVDLDHSDSNYRMIREAMFDPAGVSSDHQFPVERAGVAPPEQVAGDYELDILQWVQRGGEKSTPQFDVVFLGMGTDGHTASLFPHTKALHPPESRAFMANYVDKLNAWRLTITPDVITTAHHVIVLVTGEDKAEALKLVLEGKESWHNYPAQIVRNLDSAVWLVDEAAAARLQQRQAN